MDKIKESDNKTSKNCRLGNCLSRKNTNYFDVNSKIAPLQCLEAAVQICSVKKAALKNFAKFTGKRLCQGGSL